MTPSYRLTDRGLTVAAKLTYEEWRDIGAKLARHYSGIQWAIGDWLLAIPRKQTWEATFEDVREIVPFCWETLRTHRTVAEAFEHEERAVGLSWSFYRLAIPLEPAQRMPALREAFRRRITYAEFTKWVELRMRQLPTTRIKNATDRAPAGGRPGRPRRTAGEVRCPHCGHKFRTIVEQPEHLQSAIKGRQTTKVA